MNTSNKHQLFAILNLLPSATEKEVKKAYRRLALLHHPDKDAERDPEHMKVINNAYSEIMAEKLYRQDRTGSSSDEDESWYEFTQLWKPTPEEFQQFNDECIAAYVERHDDEIRSSVPKFDVLPENEQRKLRHTYRVWLNGSKKLPFQPHPSTLSPSSTPNPQDELTQSTNAIPLDDHTRSIHRKPTQIHAQQDNFILEYLDVILGVFVGALVTLALCLSIVSPESLRVWFLCYVIMTLCAPVGWTDSIARWSGCEG